MPCYCALLLKNVKIISNISNKNKCKEKENFYQFFIKYSIK